MTSTTAHRSSGIGRFVPALDWMRNYETAWLSRDIAGGLAAGAVVIPQAMAYATIANLPVEVGLYTCMLPMLVYALLGGSRTLSVSTTSTVAALTGSTLIASGVAAQSSDPARELATLTILVGVILLGARLLRLGSLIEGISEATLIGVKFGVGLTVAASQLPKLFGVEGDPSASAFFGSMRGLINDFDDVNWPTVALSLATLTIMLGLGRIRPLIPAPLVAAGFGIILVRFWSIQDAGVALIAPVPSGLPLPVLPSLDRVGPLLGGAFAIAIMCFLETASAGGAVRRPREPAIDSNQELFANGLACVLGGFFRSMPSAGGFSQTAINVKAGARTQLSQLITATLAVACALFLGGILNDLPEATLGAMVVVAVLSLIRPAELTRLWKIDRNSFWVAATTAGAGLVFGLIEAVLIGVLLTLLLVLHELNRVGVDELQLTDSRDDLLIADDSTHAVPGLLVLRLGGPLYTANVRSVGRQIVALVEAAQPDVVVIDVSATLNTSVTVIARLEETERALSRLGVVVWLAALPTAVLDTAHQLPVWSEWREAGRLHPTALSAVRAFARRSTDGSV